MFKTKYIRANKRLYALPAAVQESYFRAFDLEPKPLTTEHLEHIRNGLEEYLDNVEGRDLQFRVSNGVIRQISIYSRSIGSNKMVKDTGDSGNYFHGGPFAPADPEETILDEDTAISLEHILKPYL